MIELAQRNLVTIYGVSTMAFGFANEDRDNLERLANRDRRARRVSAESGPVQEHLGVPVESPGRGQLRADGRHGAYEAEIAKRIPEAVTSVSGEITTQYVLRYVPDVDPEAKPKECRRIKVDIPGLPNVKLHHRPGYWADDVRDRRWSSAGSKALAGSKRTIRSNGKRDCAGDDHADQRDAAGHIRGRSEACLPGRPPRPRACC